MKCQEHAWEFEESDPIGCPVCYGAKQAEGRIIERIRKFRAESVENGVAEIATARSALNTVLVMLTGDLSEAAIKGESK